jgi:hypothetical protein
MSKNVSKAVTDAKGNTLRDPAPGESAELPQAKLLAPLAHLFPKDTGEEQLKKIYGYRNIREVGQPSKAHATRPGRKTVSRG